MACSSRASAFAGAQVAFVPPTRRCGAAPGVLVVECAHKKGAGSVKNGQDSEAKRLGVKIYGDQPAFSGNIILRQRGTVWTPGPGTMMGKDHTIFAVEDGLVKFEKSAVRARICVVQPLDEPEEGAAPAASTRRTRKFAQFPPRETLRQLAAGDAVTAR